jgi:hypothetical protein
MLQDCDADFMVDLEAPNTVIFVNTSPNSSSLLDMV